MNFAGVYRASFYLMLLFATLSLDVDVSESKVAWLFPPGVAIAAVIAYFSVDRNPRLGLARPMAYILLLVSLALAVLEYRSEENLVLSLAHFLVYLQLVKMLLPKTVEDDWLLFCLGVAQVLVGAVISQSDREGTMLFCWALMSLWVLGLFYLHREALRAHLQPGIARVKVASPDDSYPGLINASYIFSAVRVMATTLALGGIIFLLMPRASATVGAKGIEASGKHLTGFDDEVQLGKMGEILESDSVVMSVEFRDLDGDRVTPTADSLLWRGVTLDSYQDGRWHRRSRPRDQATFPELDPPDFAIRQIIKLEPTDSDVLFGVRPMFGASAAWHRAAIPNFSELDGTVYRHDVSAGAYDYSVLSSTDFDLPQPSERLPGTRQTRNLVAVPEEIRAQLATFAESALAREAPGADDPHRRAKALEHHLRDSGEYGYTLNMDVVDRTIDPVIDFLSNRKQGHCEYFASALTLLLRSQSIPARMVNGFKGGDWSSFGQVLSVRQKHAHSWVEALVPDATTGKLHWITLDPTPATARAASLAEVGGINKNWRQVTDFVRYIWIFYILGFNSERQRALLYQPISELAAEARKGFSVMGEWLRATIAELLTFKDLGQFFSRRGFVVSFSLLVLLVLLYRVTRWVFVRILRWLHGPLNNDSAAAAGVVFYRRLVSLLAEFGLERPPAETQQEFARRAMIYLTGRGSETAVVAEVPSHIVDAFYRIRFGHRELNSSDLAQLEKSLDALEACLHPEKIQT